MVSAPIMTVVRYSRAAMGTLFECVLLGDDEEHLAAVAEALWDEVGRIERMLSRFDPAAEVSRINREAARHPTIISFELFEILSACRCYQRETDGYFDVTTTSRLAQKLEEDTAEKDTAETFILDESRRTVQFVAPGPAIDLGAYGKGYALDRCADILRSFGIRSALLHAGTSSVLAIGRRLDDKPWIVGIRDPSAEGSLIGLASPAPSMELEQVELFDRSLSCSATLHPGQRQSDIVDPQTGDSLITQAGCVVIAPTGVEAEVLSTACLCMGKEAAFKYIEQKKPSEVRVAWIDASQGQAKLQWLSSL